MTDLEKQSKSLAGRTVAEGPTDTPQFDLKQKIQMDYRAGFLKAYKKRDRSQPDIDPVLKSHLGLK